MPSSGVQKILRQHDRRAEQRQNRQLASALSPAAAAAFASATSDSTFALAPAAATVDKQLCELLSRVRQSDTSIAAAFLHSGDALFQSLQHLHAAGASAASHMGAVVAAPNDAVARTLPAPSVVVHAPSEHYTQFHALAPICGTRRLSGREPYDKWGSLSAAAAP